MATKKSSTKAKPKTRSNKSASKTTRAAKASAKSVSTKVTRSAKATAKVTALPAAASRGKQSPMLLIRKILAASAALYILLAVAAGTYMTASTNQLTAGYLTADTLASKASTVFAPATRVVYDIELRWVLVGLMVLSAIFPILYLTRLQRSYSERLGGRVLAWRWVDFAISGALMVEVVALLSGMQDLASLKLAGGLIAAAALFSWLAERRNENLNRPMWGELYASLACLALVGVVIAMYAVSTPIHGLVRSPWYIYALYGVLVASYALIVINQVNQHRRFRSWSNYMIVERNHLVISLLGRAAFAAVLISGLAK